MTDKSEMGGLLLLGGVGGAVNASGTVRRSITFNRG